MAVAAHPDDIEFQMAGTLLLLKQEGWEIHYMNLSSGSCGSLEHPPSKLRRIRRAEAEEAAALLGARYHPSLCDDLEILYELETLRRLAAVVREVQPRILLIPSPQDYMEDHANTSRLAVTAAFARGVPNFRTVPPRQAVEGEVTLYHGMPHGLRDGLRRRIVPGIFVDTAAVHQQKMEALGAHRSQQAWLDASQQMNSYLEMMDDMALDLGRMSKQFKYAEGWRRHSHLGFCAAEADPLRDALGQRVLVNEAYEKDLEPSTSLPEGRLP